MGMRSVYGYATCSCVCPAFAPAASMLSFFNAALPCPLFFQFRVARCPPFAIDRVFASDLILRRTKSYASLAASGTEWGRSSMLRMYFFVCPMFSMLADVLFCARRKASAQTRGAILLASVRTLMSQVPDHSSRSQEQRFARIENSTPGLKAGAGSREHSNSATESAGPSQALRLQTHVLVRTRLFALTN